MDISLTQKLRQKMGNRPRTRGRYHSSELYFINKGLTTPEEWFTPREKETKEMLKMWSGIGMHNQLEDLLGKENSEQKKEISYKGLVLVGKVDFMPPDSPDELWEFKTSEKLMKTSKPWHDYQVKLYCTMFGKKRGMVLQPVQTSDGIYLKHLKTIERDDEWFKKELESLYVFHEAVEKLWIKKGLTNSK